MGDYRMPSLGADMEVGTIVEWRVQPGDVVHRGDIIAVVDTDKSTIEVEVFEDGVIEELLVEPGVEVPIGTALARIGNGATAMPAIKTPAITTPATTTAATTTPAAAPAVTTATQPHRARSAPTEDERFTRASPIARREAASRGLDLDALAGTGPGGAVVLRDLDGAGAVPSPPSPPAPPPVPSTPREEPDRQAAMRRAIGALMARSKREIPHYYLATSVDLGAAMAWLADANSRRPVTERLLPAALLLKATALAAKEVPAMNGFWDGALRPSPAVHLGVAVSLRGGGLVAPAIHDADRLTLDELMQALRDLVHRTRAGVLRSSEMSDPTITVTNLGDQGVDEVFGVIYPPQVALVGFGRIDERPWARGGLLGVRPVVRCTLAADHRASDGHDGARFLTVVERLLQAPEDL